MHHPGNNDILREDQLNTKRFLKPQRVEEIERETQAIKWALSGRSEYDGDDLSVVKGGQAPDREYLRECLQRNESTLNEGRPPTGLSQVQLAKYHKEELRLRQELMHPMPTDDMMMRPTEQNVQWAMGWNQHYTGKAVAWQNVREILRTNLDPTNRDPFVTSIETLRGNTPPKGDPRSFRLNFDNIRFSESIERALTQIDDTTFRSFVYYKGLDWSDTSIKRELGLDQAMFEACLDRLAEERHAAQHGHTLSDVSESNGHTPAPPPSRVDDVYAMIGQPKPSLSAHFSGHELRDFLKATSRSQPWLAKEMRVPVWKVTQWAQQRRPIRDDERVLIRKALKLDDPSAPETSTNEHEQVEIHAVSVEQ